jgi:hypothetical protein
MEKWATFDKVPTRLHHEYIVAPSSGWSSVSLEFRYVYTSPRPYVVFYSILHARVKGRRGLERRGQRTK